ncbi:MAG: hypothetical protein R6V10_14140 [bacterium]
MSLNYMKHSHLDVLWNLDPAFYLAITEKTVASLMEPLGAGGYIKGMLAGYSPSVNLRYQDMPKGCPPVMYSRSNYFMTGKKELLRLIKADAALAAPKGQDSVLLGERLDHKLCRPPGYKEGPGRPRRHNLSLAARGFPNCSLPAVVRFDYDKGCGIINK